MFVVHPRGVHSQSLLLTGLTRDGVYLIEGGEITAAVNNFRFNESPIDLLRRFTHASTSAWVFPRANGAMSSSAAPSCWCCVCPTST